MYAIVDIETTGGYAERNSIVEIAIYVTDGKEILLEYEQLINPQKHIPASLTAIHGITDEMVEDAPTFEAIAEEVHEILKDKIFVAHSVNFDYTFIKNALEFAGISFRTKKLCTVRTSRKIFPGFPSYSLGNLCERLKIPLHNRHRAAGDALATVKLFHMLLQNDQEDVIAQALNPRSRETILPDNLEKNTFLQLPEAPGVYYFHDKKGKVIYVGKAKNIFKRVTSHFSGKTESYSRQAFQKEVYDISYELTGNELVAFLLEANEIKRLWPRYNSAQKRPEKLYCLYQFTDRNGYIRFAIGPQKKGMPHTLLFYSFAEARNWVHSAIKAHDLCPKLAGLQKGEKSCYDYTLGLCKGACVEEESAKVHNAKMEEALLNHQQLSPSYLLVGKGRTVQESSIVWVAQGVYKGFGFVDKEETIDSHTSLEQFIQPQKNYPEISRILQGERWQKEMKKVMVKG